VRQRLCQHGCWHRAYRDVFTASFDGHPGAEFRSTMSIIRKNNLIRIEAGWERVNHLAGKKQGLLSNKAAR
ncbi:MAG: hypothetical protein KGZ88_14790, partial [Methylomicrobium sp.]|nr:hypothetical protein [Methylomicrobium sp.]